MFTAVWCGTLSFHLLSDLYPAHFLEKLPHISAPFNHGTCIDHVTVLGYHPNLYSRKELVVMYT